MNELPHISLRLHGSMPAADCVALAKMAEELGFAGIWFAENAFARGILPAAAVCAAATSRLQINTGVFNPFSRHPTMMAMEIGALDELSKGRATLSIGSGIIAAVGKIGFDAHKPLPALRDTLTIVRGLLRGEEVDHVGPAFSARKVKLDFAPRADIAIFLAGRGNLTTKLAGEAADGLIISNMCSPEFAREVAELTRASRNAAGRSGEGRVIQYMPCAVGEDRAEAAKTAKRAIGTMLPGFWSLGQKLELGQKGIDHRHPHCRGGIRDRRRSVASRRGRGRCPRRAICDCLQSRGNAGGLSCRRPSIPRRWRHGIGIDVRWADGPGEHTKTRKRSRCGSPHILATMPRSLICPRRSEHR